jgi:hypothetical protein
VENLFYLESIMVVRVSHTTTNLSKNIVVDANLFISGGFGEGLYGT